MTTMDALIAETQAVIARLDALVAEGERSRFFPRRNTGPVLVSPDPSKPGRWRATRFDIDRAPIGHVEAATFRDALDAARHAGAIFDAHAEVAQPTE